MVWKYVERGSWSYYLMGLAAGELIPLSCLFMLELVLASGQPVVNFASVTMSWVFFLHLLLVPLTFGQLYLCGLSLFRLVV